MTSDAAVVPAAPTDRPSVRIISSVFLAFMAVQLFAYWNAFKVKPASDDWPIINEIHRGNREGVRVFFTDSVIRIGYRPLKSLAIWFFGNLSQDNDLRVGWIRAMHLGAAWCYAVVALLWVRELPIGRAGSAAALAIVFLHPVLAAPIGSIDGIDTLASSTLLWLGAWCTWRFRDRLPVALLTTLACLVVGVGFKENLFALVPLSVVVVVLLWPSERRRVGGLTLGIGLSIAAAAAIIVRRFVIRGGLEAGAQMLDFSPRQLAENASLFASGLLFFGNTVWVFVHRSDVVLTMVAAACAIPLVLIITGVRKKVATQHAVVPVLITGLLVAAFPTILLYHVSEMYVAPMVLPFALLAGLAADEWSASPRGHMLLVGVGIVALISSFVAIRSKVAGLVDVGERADRQLKQVLNFVPPGSTNLRILLLFDERDLPPRRTYSVFRMGDDILLVHEITPEWYRPGDGLKLQSLVTRDYGSADASADASHYDAVLGWDARSQRFVRIR
jgi:hypothetical protein